MPRNPQGKATPAPSSLRRLEFTRGPFFFDPSGQVRCVKCGDAGWIADGTKAIGLPWAIKRALRLVRGRPQAPSGWTVAGGVPDGMPVDAWKTVLSENLQQARHVELQRLGFAGLYGGLSVAASVSSLLLGPGQDRVEGSLPFAFMALYTAFQFLLSLKLSKAFEHNMEHVSLALALAPAGAVPAALFRPMEGMVWMNRWTRMRVSTVFPLFYAVLTLFWTAAVILAW